MKARIEKIAAERKRPALWERLRDSLFGLAIVALAAFLKWKGVFANDLYFLVLVMFGGMFLSKSLVVDFVAAIKDKLK